MDVKRFTFLVVLLLLAGQAFAQTQPVVATGRLSAASADCTIANSCVTLMMSPNSGGVAIRLAGTSTQTAQFEATVDGTGWVSISGTPIPTTTAVTSATAAGAWQFGTSGLAGIRVRTSAFTDGAFQAVLQSSSSNPGTGGSGGGGGGAVTVADGADVSLGLTTDIANCAVDTTSVTVIEALKCANYIMQTPTGPATAANSNAVIPAYNTMVNSGKVALTTTASISVVAGTASNYLYITSCTVSNASLTVSTDIILQDGSGGTTLWNIPNPAATVATTGGGGAHITWPTPLKVPTSGNALYAANVTSNTSQISCNGFRSTISY